MKTIDITAIVLLAVGGLNWGLVGAINFDLVAAIFGQGSALARVVYVVVGLAAIYQILSLSTMKRRWHVAAA